MIEPPQQRSDDPTVLSVGRIALLQRHKPVLKMGGESYSCSLLHSTSTTTALIRSSWG